MYQHTYILLRPRRWRNPGSGWRLNRSITQAKYSQPSSAAMSVMSLLQTRSGVLGVP
jgi:hypothetical protein